MDIDDKDFPLVRKNLNILSILILILAYTNAKLDSLNFLGIQIDLNAHKLYVAIFILYIYMIWRFLTKLPLRGGFWNGFEQFYMDGDEGVKKEHGFNRFKDYLLTNYPKLNEAFKANSAKIVSTSITRFSKSLTKKLRVIVSFQTSNEFGDNGGNGIYAHSDFEVSSLYLLRKLTLFCFKYDAFGDYLFPIVPILINISFFIFNSEWQGSFSNLWF